MPEKRKEPRNCHNCGLESLDDCESRHIHIPDDEKLAPCKFCCRSKYSPRYAENRELSDFYSQMWTRDEERDPLLEDPDPHEQSLLKMLHERIIEVKTI